MLLKKLKRVAGERKKIEENIKDRRNLSGKHDTKENQQSQILVT